MEIQPLDDQELRRKQIRERERLSLISDDEILEVFKSVTRNLNPLPVPSSYKEERDCRLQLFGFYLLPVDGDGNCLLRAVSHQIFHTEHHYELLRRIALAQLRLCGKFYKKLWNFTDLDYEDMLTDCRSLDQPTKLYTCYAIADVLEVEFYVMNSHLVVPITMVRPTNPETQPKQVYYLCLTKSDVPGKPGHCDSMLPKDKHITDLRPLTLPEKTVKWMKKHKLLIMEDTRLLPSCPPKEVFSKKRHERDHSPDSSCVKKSKSSKNLKLHNYDQAFASKDAFGGGKRKEPRHAQVSYFPELKNHAKEEQRAMYNIDSRCIALGTKGSICSQCQKHIKMTLMSMDDSQDTTADTNVDSDQADTQENTPTIDKSQEGRVRQPQFVDMHFEQNDGVVHDVGTASQESSGSGATLGESLRCLDVEIVSTYGQDDGGERQGPMRNTALLGNTSVSLRDASLHSVTEVSEIPSQDTDQSDPAQDEPPDGAVGSAPIDPVFLDALPEELRAKVLSGRQGQVAHPPNIEPSDVDHEFLVALQPNIRAEVIAQQQVQVVHRSCELEDQPVEVDTVSKLRKEVLYKPHLQRLLLNLCAHIETHSSVVKIQMDDIRNPGKNVNTSEPSYRLYACQSYVVYYRPQRYDGVPPLVSWRVLETLTYLARNHITLTCLARNHAKLLLQFRFSPVAEQESQSFDQSYGKAIMIVQDNETEKQQDHLLVITMLLSLLNHPLYLISIAHLEQLNLLDVIIEYESTLDANSGVSGSNTRSPKADDASKPSSSGFNTKYESHAVMLNLPQTELHLLCSLLARESLLDNAYALVAEVLKKLLTIAPRHCHVFMTELAGAIKILTTSAMDELHRFSEIEKALVTTTASDRAAILRVIQALCSLAASLNQDKDQALPENEQTATLSIVGGINTASEPLWTELSTCISKIESYSDTSPDLSDSLLISSSRPSGAMPQLPAGTQNMLPYMESFFVMCEKLHPGNPAETPGFGANIEEATTSGQSLKVDEKHVVFVKFPQKHRKLLNAFIRQNPGLLKKFSLLC